MREVDLRGVDLNLLPVLAALLSGRSVTRAANLAGLSQPAMSRALARLRALLGDPLLVQGRLTPRAERMIAPLAAALGAVDGVLRSDGFDPARATGTVRLGAADVQSVTMLPRLVPGLRAAAPALDLVVESLAEATFDRLRSGQLDLAFTVAGNWSGSGLKQQTLYAEGFLCMLRRGHPAARAWNAAGFAALEHVVVSTPASGPGPVDIVLAELGLRRRVALRVPHFFAAFGVVAATDMVVTLPASLARREAARHRLLLLDPPLPVPGFEVLMLWGEIMDAEPRHRWLRPLVAGVAAEE